jgi:hypothetical protein
VKPPSLEANPTPPEKTSSPVVPDASPSGPVTVQKDDTPARPNEQKSSSPEDPGDHVMNPPGLKLEQWEAEFMLKLAPILGRSPRSVKRFVNVYRLIRSTVDKDLLAFVGTDVVPGNYQATQVLLAVIVGQPRISEDLFTALRKQPRSDLVGVVGACRAESGEAKREEWKTLHELLQGSASPFPSGRQVSRELVDRVSRYSFRVGRR